MYKNEPQAKAVFEQFRPQIALLESVNALYITPLNEEELCIKIWVNKPQTHQHLNIPKAKNKVKFIIEQANVSLF